MNEDSRTVWCGNLSDKVTEELLYELFLQVAPLDRVRIPSDKEGRKSNFGFVTLKHEISVDYVTQMLDGTELYNRRLTVKPRHSNQNQRPPPAHNHHAQQQLYHHHHQNHTENVMMNNLNDVIMMGQLMQLNYNANQGQHSSHSYRKPYDRQENYGHNHNRDNKQGGGRSGQHRNNHSRNYNGKNRRGRYY